MICGRRELLYVLLLCGLQEAAASPRGRCAGGLCCFEDLLDFRGAETSCQKLNGKLFASKDTKTITSLLKGLSGTFWLGNADSQTPHACPAVSVTRGQDVTALSVPCKDKLDGYVCRYDPNDVCRPLQTSGNVKYATMTGSELVGSEMLPPGTLATVGDGQYPDSKHLCHSKWTEAPWSCEVIGGGCEHECRSGNGCICAKGDTLHPNNFSCITKPCAACAQGCQKKGDSYVCTCDEGYRLAPDGKSCEDVNECEEKRGVCTSEGEKCVNKKGGHECECAFNYIREDGVCVNNAICFLCEHNNCVKINGVYQCRCNEGFRVSPENQTKCERYCGQSQCPAQCDRNQGQTKDTQQCFCPQGYILEISNQTAVCHDINECEQQRQCDHSCENTYGGYRCCDEGFKVVDGVCVKEDEDDERGSGSSSETVTPADVQTDALPPYVKTGSVMGITVFLVLGAVLLFVLARKVVKRCGRFQFATFKHPDIDIFYLQQVTTETYKRLSFDKQFKNDSQR